MNEHVGVTRADSTIRTVLLVSDDSYLRPMIRAFLEHLGFGVIVCTECLRAEEIILSSDGVKLLLVDLGSAGSAGVELALRLDRNSINLPVVMLAGLELHREEMQAIEAHQWRLLKKPLRVFELLGVIQRAFDRKYVNGSISSVLEEQGVIKFRPSFSPNPARAASGARVSSSNKVTFIRPKTEGDIRKA